MKFAEKIKQLTHNLNYIYITLAQYEYHIYIYIYIYTYIFIHEISKLESDNKHTAKEEK